MAKKTLRPTKKEAKDFLKEIGKVVDRSRPLVVMVAFGEPDGRISWAWLGHPENIIIASEILKSKALRMMEEMGRQRQMKANEDDERRIYR